MPNNQRPRKKRDTSRKREAILDGAVKVFIEKGYDVSSMDEIADTAGVSKRTVYNHFESKEALFRSVVEDFVSQRDHMKPIKYTQDRPLDEQLKAFATAELYLIDDPVRRGLSKVLTSFFLMDVTMAKEIIGQKSPHKNFIQWLCAAQNDHTLDYPSPELAAQVFYGLVEGCLTYPALLSNGDSLKYAEPILDEIVSVFLSRYRIHP